MEDSNGPDEYMAQSFHDLLKKGAVDSDLVESVLLADHGRVIMITFEDGSEFEMSWYTTPPDSVSITPPM